MASIPKPKHCNQHWLEMQPTDSGRICGQCQKHIVDFSKMKWAEIEAIQRANNHTVCGMYSNKQLKYWGQEVPCSQLSKSLTTAALLLSLSTALTAQNTVNVDTCAKRIVIRGFVSGESFSGEVERLPYTNVTIKNYNIGTATDANGYYEIDLTNYIDTIKKPVLVIQTIGYETHEYQLPKNLQSSILYNQELKLDMNNITYFYVGKPSFAQRVKSFLGRLFVR